MSWDIELVVDVDGHQVTVSGEYNYTHNCNGMIRDAGFAEFPYDVDGMSCETFCSKLNDAIHALRADRKKYVAMDPENGWGSYETLVPVLTKMHDDFDRFPSAKVRCSP